jgi:hypothetical protein
MGMTGFDPQQRAVLEASLVRPAGLPRWRISAFGDADAWWVNGAKVRVLPDGNLKVGAGLPTERALNLNLTDVDRPVAFAAPIASADFEPRYSFDPVSEPSIHAVLLQFESWLWLARAQFVLGAQIIRRGPELRHGIYHVSHSGRLLAVLDFQRAKAAISPRVHPERGHVASASRESQSGFEQPQTPFPARGDLGGGVFSGVLRDQHAEVQAAGSARLARAFLWAGINLGGGRFANQIQKLFEPRPFDLLELRRLHDLQPTECPSQFEADGHSGRL